MKLEPWDTTGGLTIVPVQAALGPEDRGVRLLKARQRDPPRAVADGGAAGRAAVASTRMHGRGLQPRPVARERPRARLGRNPTHPRRRARPALPPRTPTENPTRLVPRARNGQTTVRPTHRPPPPQIPSTTRPISRFEKRRGNPYP